MASKDVVRTRAPRGTKTVTHAFFEALDGIAASQQKAVAAAALASIRDELKTQRAKTKAATAKAKTKAKAPAGRVAPAPRVNKAATAARRAPAAGRKQAAPKKAPAAKVVPGRVAKRKSSRKLVSAPPKAATE
jgi:hypothetical protein